MKVIYKLNVILVAVLAFFMVGCSEDEREFPLVLPSNLSVSIVKDTANIGNVDVKATATNANFFTIYFNENGVMNKTETTSGEASFQFKTNGSFPIIVRAHSTTEAYVEAVNYVTIGQDTSGPIVDPGIPATGYTTPLSYQNYALVWNDEFDGTTLNSSDWTYETGTGNGGWGNSELQYYLERNTTVANGFLTIEAKDEFFNNSNYTSSRIITQNKRSFQYGRIDIRAAMPEGQGLWPALWMLGDNISTVSWPKCGEIDIMEMVGGVSTPDRGDDVTHGTAHWENGNGVKADFGDHIKSTSGKLSAEFHVYSIIWDSQAIRWYFDDVKYHELNITSADMSEFHQKYFFILNVAVGGVWPGSPDGTTVFPQKMYVDYIRVFQ